MIKSVFKTKSKEYNVDYEQLLLDIVEKQGVISKCFEMFHEYSIRNQFLAYHQMKMRGMDICPINSFTGWNKLERSINRGEKALWLWQPFTIKEKTYNTKTKEFEDTEKVIFTLKPRWFALSQTNGKELKQAEHVKIGEFDFDKVYKLYNIKIVPFDKLNGNSQGFARHGSEHAIALNPLVEDAEMTLLHEIAHVALGHTTDRKDLCHALKEIEVESVAYIVGNITGIDEDALARSRGYIQSYIKELKQDFKSLPKANVEKIMSVASKIINTGLGLNKSKQKQKVA